MQQCAKTSWIRCVFLGGVCVLVQFCWSWCAACPAVASARRYNTIVFCAAVLSQ